MTRPTLKAFWAEVEACWPPAKGCLCAVRMSCVRPRCRACREGRKHPAFIFSFMENGRKRCLYVPRGLVPALRQALGNGRRLQERIAQIGPELIRAYREGCRRSPGPKTGNKP